MTCYCWWFIAPNSQNTLVPCSQWSFFFCMHLLYVCNYSMQTGLGMATCSCAANSISWGISFFLFFPFWCCFSQTSSLPLVSLLILESENTKFKKKIDSDFHSILHLFCVLFMSNHYGLHKTAYVSEGNDLRNTWGMINAIFHKREDQNKNI